MRAPAPQDDTASGGLYVEQCSASRQTAFGAAPVERQVVALHGEACWCQPGEIARTGVHVEHPVAPDALEVVMVTVRCGFVTRVFAGQVDGEERTLFNQALEVAIDRSDPDTRDIAPGCREHLARQQRAVGVLDSDTDCGPLTGVALHFARIPESAGLTK